MESKYPDQISIIQAIRDRAPEVFNYIHEKCFDTVSAFVAKNSGDEKDGEDIYGEGIACLIEVIDKPDLEMSSKVSTLFIRICINLWMNLLDKRKLDLNYSSSIEEPEYEENFEEQMDDPFMDDIFWQSFMQLKENCQDIIKLFFIEGKRIKEIAERLGFKPASLRTMKYNCQKSLRNILGKHPDFEEIRINESL